MAAVATVTTEPLDIEELDNLLWECTICNYPNRHSTLGCLMCGFHKPKDVKHIHLSLYGEIKEVLSEEEIKEIERKVNEQAERHPGTVYLKMLNRNIDQLYELLSMTENRFIRRHPQNKHKDGSKMGYKKSRKFRKFRKSRKSRKSRK